jgi:hypothetical protein
MICVFHRRRRTPLEGEEAMNAIDTIAQAIVNTNTIVKIDRVWQPGKLMMFRAYLVRDGVESDASEHKTQAEAEDACAALCGWD